MGRRPHALIQEFFDRGPKLDDNSNRYQHTCKRCGEFFPKGRIDSLTTHLLRRCSNLSHPDRTWVFQQLQTSLEKPQRPAKRRHVEQVQDVIPGGDMEYQSETLPPFAHQQPSALETLAEVSGQHSSRSNGLNFTESPDQQAQDSAASVAESIAEQALLAQLHGQSKPNEALANNSASAANDFSFPTTSPPMQQSIQSSLSSEHHPASISNSSLVQAASAASQQLDQEQSGSNFTMPHFGPTNNSPFQSFNIPIDMGFRMTEPITGPEVSWMQAPVTGPAPSFGSLSLPPNDPMAGYGILASNARQKPRSRFGDVRRKEVSEIRKQGACLRCRMLKKPCSGGTPCKTCANVESARIWKGKCLRTRLADELPLWSAKMFERRAETKLRAAHKGLQDTGNSTQVQISMRESSAPITLPAKKYRPSSTTDGAESDPPDEPHDHQQSLWTLNIDDRAENKLGAYVRSAIGPLIETQPPLMRDILQRTNELVLKAPNEESPTSGNRRRQPDQSNNSSTSQHDLSKNVLELRSLTELLTGDTPFPLDLKVLDPPAENADASPPSQDIPADAPTHDLIRAQLLAASESRCAKLGKSILNELEKRLLQRHQTSRLATLLSALLLLDCVESMTAYYQSLSTPPPPSTLAQTGPTFAALLTSLLRMRALPPKTKVSAAGKLESIRDFGTSGSPARRAGESREAAAEWVDGLGLDAGALRGERDGEGWRGRFVGAVLLPEAWNR